MQERKPSCICELDTETGEPVVANYAECQVHKPDAITPKDTAREFVDKFSTIGMCGCDCQADYDMTELLAKEQKDNQKQCAIIITDEILSVLDTFQAHAYAKILIPYYKEVKQEIHNL
jgi:hypothetical protein